MLLRDQIAKPKLGNTTWLLIGVGFMIVGGACIVWSGLVLVHSWQQFEHGVGMLEWAEPLFSGSHNSIQKSAILSLLVGGGMLALGWSEARAARRISRGLKA